MTPVDRIHLSGHSIPDGNLALINAHRVHDDVLDRTLDIEHLKRGVRTPDHAEVGVLPTRFWIERGFCQYDLNRVSGLRDWNADAVLDEGNDVRCHVEFVIAAEHARSGGTYLLISGEVAVTALLCLRIGTGTVLLLLHERAERLFINAESLLSGHLKGEIDRESVRVVKSKRLGAADDRAA